MMDWVVTGSRPPSAMSSRPSSVMSSRPGSSLHYDNIFQAKNQSQGYSYADRLFGQQDGQDSARFNNRTVTPSPSARSVKIASKHNPSFVDDTLFGPTPRDDKFEALWGGNTLRSLKNGHTDRTSETQDTSRTIRNTTPKKKLHNQTYNKSLSKGSDIENSTSRTGTPSKLSNIYGGKKHFKGVHTPSYVDEMLFGQKPADPDFAAPWESSQPSPKPYAFDATDYKAKAQQSETLATPKKGSAYSARGTSTTHSRPPSVMGVARPPSVTPPRPGSACKKAPKQLHNPTYVDEMLFGPRPSEPNFPAPWEDQKAEKKRPKPFLFDTTDYSKTSGRPESARNKSRPGSGASPKKPAWR